MRSRWSAGWVVAAAVAVMLAAETPAHAYIDPGSGSLIYQALIAGILGLGFTLRRTTEAVSRIMRRLTGRPEPEADTSEPNPDRL